MTSAKILVLPSGAKLTIRVDVDLFDLAPDDRDLVFGIVDQALRFLADAEMAVSGSTTCPDCANPLRLCDCPDRQVESWDAATGEKP